MTDIEATIRLINRSGDSIALCAYYFFRDEGLIEELAFEMTQAALNAYRQYLERELMRQYVGQWEPEGGE